MKSKGVELIATERERQVSVEGWTAEHDAEHDCAEMAGAAICYTTASFTPNYASHFAPASWPWSAELWKPSEDPIRNLVKAGALIAAEIDRISLQAEGVKDGAV